MPRAIFVVFTSVGGDVDGLFEAALGHLWKTLDQFDKHVVFTSEGTKDVRPPDGGWDLAVVWEPPSGNYHHVDEIKEALGTLAGVADKCVVYVLLHEQSKAYHGDQRELVGCRR